MGKSNATCYEVTLRKTCVYEKVVTIWADHECDAEEAAVRLYGSGWQSWEMDYMPDEEPRVVDVEEVEDMEEPDAY